MSQQIQQLDIRDGEFFAFHGKDIKKSIDARRQSVLRPAYEKAMNNITELVGDADHESTAALIVALQGNPDDWSAKTSEIHRNATIATEHNEEMMTLARMGTAFSDDVRYVVNEQQLKRFGLCS